MCLMWIRFLRSDEEIRLQCAAIRAEIKLTEKLIWWECFNILFVLVLHSDYLYVRETKRCSGATRNDIPSGRVEMDVFSFEFELYFVLSDFINFPTFSRIFFPSSPVQTSATATGKGKKRAQKVTNKFALHRVEKQALAGEWME